MFGEHTIRNYQGAVSPESSSVIKKAMQSGKPIYTVDSQAINNDYVLNEMLQSHGVNGKPLKFDAGHMSDAMKRVATVRTKETANLGEELHNLLREEADTAIKSLSKGKFLAKDAKHSFNVPKDIIDDLYLKALGLSSQDRALVKANNGAMSDTVFKRSSAYRESTRKGTVLGELAATDNPASLKITRDMIEKETANSLQASIQQKFVESGTSKKDFLDAVKTINTDEVRQKSFGKIETVSLDKKDLNLLNKPIEKGGLGLNINKAEKLPTIERLSQSAEIRTALSDGSQKLRNAYQNLINELPNKKSEFASDVVAGRAGITREVLPKFNTRDIKSLETLADSLKDLTFHTGTLNKITGTKALGSEAALEALKGKTLTSSTGQQIDVYKDLLKNEDFLQAVNDKKGFVSRVSQLSGEQLSETSSSFNKGTSTYGTLLQDKKVAADLKNILKTAGLEEEMSSFSKALSLSKVTDHPLISAFKGAGIQTLGKAFTGVLGTVIDPLMIGSSAKGVAENLGASKTTSTLTGIGTGAAVLGGLLSTGFRSGGQWTTAFSTENLLKNITGKAAGSTLMGLYNLKEIVEGYSEGKAEEANVRKEFITKLGKYKLSSDDYSKFSEQSNAFSKVGIGSSIASADRRESG